MKVKGPIFVIGSGRSGTTILYNILCTHPDLTFFTKLSNKFPDNPWLSVINRLYKFPLIGSFLKKSILTKTFAGSIFSPSEGEDIYRHCGFRDNIKMTANDINKVNSEMFKTIVKDHLKYAGKKRFVTKRTANTQRLELLNAIFPDAYFIHIVRDGRAVAVSLTQTPWWKSMALWWSDRKKVSELLSSGEKPMELAATHWQKNVLEILKNRRLFKKRYLEVTYEDLTNDPHKILSSILKFCRLRPYTSFFSQLPKHMDNMNYKWKDYLTPSEQKGLVQKIGPLLAKLKYK